MTTQDIGHIVFALGIVVLTTQILGYLFERLWQPPLIGEILAGVLLGPVVLGQISPELSKAVFSFSTSTVGTVLHFSYWFGLMLLMFISGSETRRLAASENHRPVAWILGIGTPLPFFLVLGLGLAGWIPLQSLMGPANNTMSVLLVLAIAVAVTSIPVISRIFHDLRILHTRFASLILGSAVLEDIILWAVLAVATALVGFSNTVDQSLMAQVSSHVGATVLYTAAGLFLFPTALKWLQGARWNFIVSRSPVAYILLVMMVYAAAAAVFDVSLIFAAFLAGFGLVGGAQGSERHRFAEALKSVSKVAFALFIPIYFAGVGHKLVFGAEFSFGMLGIFLFGSSVLCLVSVGLAVRLAGFRGLDVINLAIATNARGGPGIVLATVAYERGIINASFYTTLVLTALLTSQAAGAWLRFVLSKKWPLLSTDPYDGPSSSS